ncbi:unnamed protein product [Ranitomeya imitator]|uniref:Laminin N-terminal domain-containing protein n=1 Tax=Ranitomeya imitator TaxID=111125 RepID=A0ABN9LRT9_9NEOB|nr:unnamed protein product [Ranitomeya imitator]
MAIYKSMDHGKTWIPFQFYSSHCRRVYDQATISSITKPMQHEATCTDFQTGVKPLTKGLVAFMPLAGRPSARRFEYSPVLQDWVTATDIRVVFNRFHHGKKFGIRKKTAFYGVSEFQVGGRCKCNGHASRCTASKEGLICDCQHNTIGPECDACKPFFYDRPWQRATPSNAHECVVILYSKLSTYIGYPSKSPCDMTGETPDGSIHYNEAAELLWTPTSLCSAVSLFSEVHKTVANGTFMQS